MPLSQMHLLLVAPSAPPKNSPEAMQVGRFLSALDPAVRVTLVTTPIVRGWQWEDSTLAVERPGLKVITPSLPVHRLTQRVLGNHRLASLHVPDADFWLPWFADQVVSRITDMPDVIYSRSAPFSAALLAQRLKRSLRRPWLMHLSDPWSGSPYRVLSARQAAVDRALEAGCVADADFVALTTEGQAAFYRDRYADRTKDIIVTPNMMPVFARNSALPPLSPKQKSKTLRIVYTGAMYGAREPSTLLDALRLVHANKSDEAKQINVDFYGNMAPGIAAAIDATPSCTRHGTVSFRDASHAQQNADVLLTIEPAGSHPLLLHFMPSKNLDYMSFRKPILAITPHGSETSRLCSVGQGWAVTPGDAVGLAQILAELARKHAEDLPPFVAPDPKLSPYRADAVTASVTQTLRSLSQTQATTENSL
ncbi:MAG: hypothetical protein U1D36_15720 [Hydrogenophaga sp.]|uniref:glycosyltransferase n=1 Tax=Hydrogenophaga sp. TaxID=1904254 RepID=UPI002730E5BB|nr:hypothetical protein [Hydrogenophaga sp.]MDP2407168.1 hypothetical protein [Hydrogenophaga sp.]MDZ4175901.1 hypothetical protein [Hydrogenophaga sp.]